MADSKPIYYGSAKAVTPVYYSAGGSGNGVVGYGGAYGTNRPYGQQYGGTDGGDDDNGVFGELTVSRILRVVSQRWLSVFVFLLVGMVAAFTVYRVSPTIYEAKSEFTMDMRRSTGGRDALGQSLPDYGNSYAEIFNTRISDWRSVGMVRNVIDQYRSDRPSSTISTEELEEILKEDTKIELLRNSRLIVISVRSKVRTLAADLANAYAKTIETFTDEENKLRCDKAVSQIHGNAEKKRREVDKIARQLMEFRTANKVDNLRSERDTVAQGVSKTTADMLLLETEQTQLMEWEKMLSAVQKDPSSYGNLSTGVPRAQEIASEFRFYQDAEGEYQKLLVAFTDNHPQVITARKAAELARQRFIDAATRALLTGRSTLQVTRNQYAILKERQTTLRNELASIEQRIVMAESGLKQLESEYEIASRVLEGLIMDENKARLEVESNNEIVRIGPAAVIPDEPVLPNPLLIFGIGFVASILLGLVFVLILDNYEDVIASISDIEVRLALRALTVLPHVERSKREDVARTLVTDYYSQFSEAIAGLRNLLDSPRYESLSRCILFISTQPGEGKTITSTSLAIAYAQTFRRTLHVDFDLRRPQVANVWGLQLDESTSFSHALQKARRGALDFAALVQPTEVEGLDVISSLPPNGIRPASIFGTPVIKEFFSWARANYDRVIVDAPPFGVVGDVVSLATMCDSTIIMCCPDRTHCKPIQYCARCLTESGANILGVVVNDVEDHAASAFVSSSHGRYGAYGYGKYGRYGYGTTASDMAASASGGTASEPSEFSDEE